MNITLRAWRAEDDAPLAKILNRPQILKNLRDGIPYPYTEKDAGVYIRAMREADPDRIFAYAICEEDTLLGSIGAFRQQNIHFRTAELGYYLDEAYWGRGIMTQTVKQFCRKLFAATDLIRIYAAPFRQNFASRRVLEKAGFAYEGTMRCSAIKGGAVLDMALYALIKDEKGNEP